VFSTSWASGRPPVVELEKGIVLSLLAYRRHWSVAWQNLCWVGQSEDFFADSLDQQIVIAAGQICSPDAARKQDIASDEKIVSRRIKAEAPRTMPRHKQHAKFQSAEIQFGSLFNQEVRVYGLCFKIESKPFEEFRIGD